MTELLDFALNTAREAGDVLLGHLGRLEESDVAYKGRVDLVTAADRKAEDVVVSAIRRRFPGHRIVAEEGAPDSSGASSCWIVDPLDGTTNFVHGLPLFGVSIAFARDGDVVVGVVHAPRLGETFHAVRGGGAALNGRPIRVSLTGELIRSLLATGFAYDRWDRADNNLAEFGRLTMLTRGVRRFGAAAIDLAYVAAGRLDGYWELGLRPWDVAAGSLLVAEAGGRVSDLAGGDAYRDGGQIVASNGRLHSRLLAALRASDRPA
jgi:myo-inositol-1(or 4)-monophosphatase